MLGQKLQASLKNANISTAEAAAYIGVSEANLYKLFKKDSFEVAYLRKAAELLKLPISSFLQEEKLESDSQISNPAPKSSGNSPKGKADNPPVPQQDLVAALAACQRELALANALVAAKDETILLLRASLNRPS